MSDTLYRTDADISGYKLEDVYSESDRIYQYTNSSLRDPENRKNRASFYLKISKWSPDSHFGEYIGFKIAQMIGFKCCDVELYKSPPQGVNKMIEYGALSFVELSENDTIITPKALIDTYRKSIGDTSKKSWIHSVDTIFNAFFKRMQDDRRPYSDFQEFKQDFINMMIYDIKFTNADRGSDNWLLRTNNLDNKIDLYPMFDNAAILGFVVDCPNTDSAEEYDEKVKEYDSNHPVTIVTPYSETVGKDIEDYRDMLKYLLQHYTKETISALNAVLSFTVEDLQAELDKLEDIDIKRKKFAIDVFKQRDREVREVYREWLENNKQKQIET